MKKRKVVMLAVAAAAFAFGLLTALRSAPIDDQFTPKVRADLFAGFRGDKPALERAMKTCEQALEVNPKDAEALVWHGSGLFFKGGQAFISGDSETGMDQVTRGIQEMDNAVALQPESVSVRAARATILFESTLFMDNSNPIRGELIDRALQDLKKMYSLQEKTLDQLGTHQKGQLLFGLADVNHRAGNAADAKAWFEKLAEQMPGTPYGERASAYLKTGTLKIEQEHCIGCHTAQ